MNMYNDILAADILADILEFRKNASLCEMVDDVVDADCMLARSQRGWRDCVSAAGSLQKPVK